MNTDKDQIEQSIREIRGQKISLQPRSIMKTHRHLLAGLVALALATCAAAQTPGPADAAALNRLSIERLQQKNAKEAVEFAEQATQADPAKPEYFSQLGIALSQRMNEVNFMQMVLMSGKLKKAFEKSVALDPNHVAGLIGLARYYTNAPEIAGGSLEKAAEFAARVQKLNPFLGELELGRVAERAEDFAGALTHYDTAAKLKPNNAGLQYACGSMLARLGRKDEARVRFETALKLNPNHESAKKALAELNQPAD
jgi:Flp pilus assembly protein TadD